MPGRRWLASTLAGRRSSSWSDRVLGSRCLGVVVACCFCGALLLDSECRDATGAAGMKCGKACCQEGQVDPPPMPEWPVWLVTLWMGRTGRDHGADGLMRSAMRKYSRQLHNALSLSSQVTTYACVRIVHEIPCHISISCLSHT